VKVDLRLQLSGSLPIQVGSGNVQDCRRHQPYRGPSGMSPATPFCINRWQCRYPARGHWPSWGSRFNLKTQHMSSLLTATAKALMKVVSITAQSPANSVCQCPNVPTGVLVQLDWVKQTNRLLPPPGLQPNPARPVCRPTNHVDSRHPSITVASRPMALCGPDRPQPQTTPAVPALRRRS
jgi:hypothetical protein